MVRGHPGDYVGGDPRQAPASSAPIERDRGENLVAVAWPGACIAVDPALEVVLSSASPAGVDPTRGRRELTTPRPDYPSG